MNAKVQIAAIDLPPECSTQQTNYLRLPEWYAYNDGFAQARFCGYKQRGDNDNHCCYVDVAGAGQIGHASTRGLT